MEMEMEMEMVVMTHVVCGVNFAEKDI